MTIELKLPELGENISKGTVTKILVKTGEAIAKGQSILELETDKAVLEVPSSAEGIVSEILIKTGAVVNVGQPIFKIKGSVILAPPKAVEESPKKQDPSPPKNAANGDYVEGTRLAASTIHVPVRKDIPAAPSVRLFARELGLDIAQVPGRGPGGRISMDDVKAYCKMLNTTRAVPRQGGAQQPLPDFAKWGPVRREAMNNVRRKTAEHLSHAWSAVAHVTQFDKADITELDKLRKRLCGTTRKLSITPFLIKIIAAALKKFPQFNASIDIAANEIIYKDYIHIGIAVDTDRGLIVPVLKNAGKMTVLQISDELTAMAEDARTRKTTLEGMQGGCFTISNLGGIGGTFFTPIVNWPQAAILGVSRAVMEPVYTLGSGEAGHFVPRLMLPLSLSYDHRLIDGADGVRFIRWICGTIEQPSKDLEQ